MVKALKMGEVPYVEVKFALSVSAYSHIREAMLHWTFRMAPREIGLAACEAKRVLQEMM